MKERKRKMIMLSLAGLLLLVGAISVSYALWERLFTQSDENKITTLDCFNITYSNESAATTLNGAVPIKEEDGLKLTPYKITIKNTCDTNAKYNVILNKKKGSTLDNKFVRTAVDKKTILLSNAQQIETRKITDYEVDSSYIIGSGFVTGQQEKTIEIRSWMDWETQATEGQNKTFTYKITIETGATNEVPKTLGDIILLNNPVHEEKPDFTKGYPTATSGDELSGLYKTQDDDGNSYYFRGKVDNNYVQFGTYKESVNFYIVAIDNIMYENIRESYDDAVEYCKAWYNIDYGYETAEECIAEIEKIEILSGEPIMWRIVRINGDKTIRLIMSNPIGYVPFNSNTYGDLRRYVGYTYDNEKSCTHTNPCKSEYMDNTFTNSNGGINSEIKTTLENWYDATLEDYDDKIAYGAYCNDTSYSSSEGNESDRTNRIYYGAYKRLFTDKQPSLLCPEPINQGGSETRLYGGVYKLKIGLLTADEMIYAGITDSSPYVTRDNYLLKNFLKKGENMWSMWSMTPASSLSSGTQMLASNTEGIISSFRDCFSAEDTDIFARPVINLNPDVTVTGSGTQEDPYVLQ